MSSFALLFSFFQDIADSDITEPIAFSSAIYMAAMMLSTVGEGVYGPVPVSPLARIAASVAVLFFLPLAAIRVSRRFSCCVIYIYIYISLWPEIYRDRLGH